MAVLSVLAASQALLSTAQRALFKQGGCAGGVNRFATAFELVERRQVADGRM